MNEKDICKTILDIVKKDEKSFLFREPAVRAFSSQKDRDYYKRTIKEPRDLGGISKKLKNRRVWAKRKDPAVSQIDFYVFCCCVVRMDGFVQSWMVGLGRRH